MVTPDRCTSWKHLALFPEVKQTKLTKKMGQKPDRQSSSQQEQNKKKKMGELTSLATQAKMFHLSIKHYCVCPDVSGHKTFREHSVIVMIYENRSLFVFNNSWCGGRFLLMCLTTDVKGVKPKTNSWCVSYRILLLHQFKLFKCPDFGALLYINSILKSNAVFVNYRFFYILINSKM